MRLGFVVFIIVGIASSQVPFAAPAPAVVPGLGLRRASIRVIEHDAVVADFGVLYANAKVENAMASQAESRYTPEGLETWRIFLHPPAQPADGRARVTYAPVDLPEIRPPEKLEIHFRSRLSTDIHDKAGADGVAYVIRAAGKEILHKVVTSHEPESIVVDVSALAGGQVVFCFETDMLGNSSYDQAWWDEPRLVVAGRRVSTTITIPFFGIEPGGLPAESVSRITVASADMASSVVVSVADLNLDLDALVKEAEADPSAHAPVPLAPVIAAGEGPDAANHTLVRILGQHGVPEIQFLAFPPEVRGGVLVESGNFWDDAVSGFAVSPFAAEPAEIRLFNRYGGWRSTIIPGFPGPYIMASGRFLPEVEHEQLAVMPMYIKSAPVFLLLFDGLGSELSRLEVDFGDAVSADASLSLVACPGEDHTVLFVHSAGAATANEVDCATGRVRTVSLGSIPLHAKLHASVFGASGLLVAGPEPELSHIWRVSPNADAARINVGSRENRFWFAASGAHAGEESKWGTIPEAKHFRMARFAHLRTDMNAARRLGNSPELRALKSYDEWLDHGLLAAGLGRSKDYDDALPTCWEPCFTHRWIRDFTNDLANVIDPETGLHRYVVLDRGNRPLSYREFNNAGFNTGSYAFGMPELDRMYIFPIRAFMKELAVRHRANPEHFVAVEPNHEHEIVSSEKDRASLGDYNLKNLQGFYTYLLQRHGSLAAVNRIYGTDFSSLFFDAPRDRGRGAWDRYAGDNPFYHEWFRYNAAVVCRRVAETWREGLLAGMPPESLTCHQIPDSYAISSLTAFSKPVQRVTPIDWMLTAGTGYGFTRYSVWYKREHNCMQGAWSSGHGMVTVGEYSALSTTPEDAYGQLKYLHKHGAMFIHCMWWPARWEKGRGYNDTFKYALKRMAEEDPVRLGVTGGVLAARPYRGVDRRFDIVSIGTGPEHTGLLKSVNADGTWEGSVYVVPFHAHVDVDTILQQPKVVLAAGGLRTPPVNDLSSGTQLEVSFTVAESAGPEVIIDVIHGEDMLPDQRLHLPIGAEKHCRAVLRFQHAMGPVRLALHGSRGRVVLRDVLVTRQRDMAARIREGVFEGMRHRGGSTFCILE